MDRLWQLGLTMPELIDIGMEVGTDVPYCIYGTTAFISGKGEKVTPLRPDAAVLGGLSQAPTKCFNR